MSLVPPPGQAECATVQCGSADIAVLPSSLASTSHQPPAALPHWPSLESCGSFPAAAAAAAGELSRSLHFQPFPRFRGTGRGQAAVWTHILHSQSPTGHTAALQPLHRHTAARTWSGSVYDRDVCCLPPHSLSFKGTLDVKHHFISQE